MSICNLCQSENARADTKSLKELSHLSFYVGPLAILWISSKVNVEHFGWKLIKDRLQICFSDAPELVSPAIV